VEGAGEIDVFAVPNIATLGAGIAFDIIDNNPEGTEGMSGISAVAVLIGDAVVSVI